MSATLTPTPTYAPPPVEGGGTGAEGARVLAANLGALFSADLRLARELDELVEGELPGVVATRSGHFTAPVSDAGGRPMWLHSRHDPMDEARRLIASTEVGGKVCFAVHGTGLGYPLVELISRVPADAMILLFEPSMPVLRRMLECVDLAKVIKSRRLTFVTSAEKAALFTAIANRTVLLSMGMASVSHPPSQRMVGAGAFHEACRGHMTDLASFSRTSLNTVVLNGRRTAENIVRNLRRYAHSAGATATGGLAALSGAYAGAPAIVVSAGPSLRKNKHLLPAAKGRAVIIAVQTALKPLLDIGVEPDFVTSLDYHDISARFFENLPKSLGTHLVAEPKATRRVLDLHPGPVSFVANDYADSLLRGVPNKIPKLPAGATVAHLAFYLARFLGCDPIMFVGQDLGFSDGLAYLPGTAYDEVWRPEYSRFCSAEMKQWEQIVRERPILRRIPDVRGMPMYTEERLFTYLQQFERDFADSPQKIFDCTEGGALKKGAAPMALAEALERFCGKAIVAPKLAAHVRFEGGATPDVDADLEKRIAEADQIAEISGQTLPLLAEIRDHITDQVRVNRAIARIDPLRSRMNELGPTYDLVTHFTQSSELKRFEADLALSATALSPTEKQRMQVRRDLLNCEAIRAAAREFSAFLSEVLREGATAGGGGGGAQ